MDKRKARYRTKPGQIWRERADLESKNSALKKEEERSCVCNSQLPPVELESELNYETSVLSEIQVSNHEHPFDTLFRHMDD